MQFLFKSTYHSWRYERKCEWVFFLNTVYKRKRSGKNAAGTFFRKLRIDSDVPLWSSADCTVDDNEQIRERSVDSFQCDTVADITVTGFQLVADERQLSGVTWRRNVM